MDDKLITMTRTELEALIEDVVERVFASYIPELLQQLVTPENMATTEEVCQALNISRQTLNNWRKKPQTKKILDPYIHKTGGKLFYNLQGIKQAIKQHSRAFGKDRDYEYKFEASASEAQKRNRKFSGIQSKIMFGKQITETEEAFYREECSLRGERSLLKG